MSESIEFIPERKRVSESIEFIPGRKRAIVKGRWDKAVTRFIKENDIRELALDRQDEFPRLREIANTPIEFITVLNPAVTDISELSIFPNLKALNLTVSDKLVYDFAKFPKLEDCTFYWQKGGETIFSCVNLKTLWIKNYKGRNFANFNTLTSLESLTISSSAVAGLSGLSALPKLKKLGLAYFRKLESLGGIEGLTGLESLELEVCRKIKSIHEISSLKNLRKLALLEMGKIESLKPIEGLKKLNGVFFYGTTNIVDGDLSVLERLPELGCTAFQNRRHYSHKSWDLIDFYRERGTYTERSELAKL